MNHDMTHCKGEGCMLRESCMRYQAHLDAKEHPEAVADILLAYNQEDECLTTGNALYWQTYDLRGREKGGAR